MWHQLCGGCGNPGTPGGGRPAKSSVLRSCFLLLPMWRGCLWGQGCGGVSAHWWGPRDGRLGREIPWEGDVLWKKVYTEEVAPEPLKVGPAYPLLPLQRLTEAHIELHLEEAQ